MAKFHLLNFVRATESDNCFAATKQAYQSVFIDSSPHCLTAPKNKKQKKKTQSLDILWILFHVW